MARIHPLRVRQGSAAACCAAVTVLAAAALAGCGSHAPAAATTAATAASRQDPVAACGKPSTPFARFWYITAGNDPGIFYKGTFRVGTATVPSLSMYVSGGPPGTGTYCVSSQHGAQYPILSTAAPRPGPIAYAGATGGTGDIVYFATRPDVTRVTVDSDGSVSSYTLDGTGELQLQPLGNGWHTAGTGYSIAGVSSVTLRAYNSAGKLVDSVTQPIATSQ
jgi:hypothetical protein